MALTPLRRRSSGVLEVMFVAVEQSIEPDSILAHAGKRVDQLALAVALDAGDADDLAGAHVEADAVTASGREPACTTRLSDLEIGFLPSYASPVTVDSQDLGAGHHRGPGRARRSCRAAHVPTLRPVRRTVTRSAISMTSLQLVGHDDDRAAVRRAA